MTSMPEIEGAAIGVDGGAGQLKFAIRRPDGKIAHTHAPGANPILIGMKDFIDRLEKGIRDALSETSLSSADIRAAGFGLSGVDRIEQTRFLSEEIGGRILPNCRRLWVGNDAMAALRQGAGKLHGLIIIAGTGSICFGVDGGGRVTRTGGWGSELGDEGSAFWIGREALQTACRMSDGRVRPSALLNVILHELEFESASDMIPWTARISRETFKQQTARLFPAIASLAAGGDEACASILDAAWRHLVRHVEAVLERMDPAERKEIDRLVCAGGIFASNEGFYAPFEQRLRQAFPSLRLVRLLEPASLGAMALGLEAEPAG